MGDRAGPDDWEALFDWVDRLNSEYSLFSDYGGASCWPAHPGVVEELAALWRAWTAAALADMEAGPAGCSDLAVWHDECCGRR